MLDFILKVKLTLCKGGQNEQSYTNEFSKMLKELETANKAEKLEVQGLITQAVLDATIRELASLPESLLEKVFEVVENYFK